MIRKRGKLVRQLMVFGNSLGTARTLIAGDPVRGTRRWWLMPLIVFLCITGLILTLAAGVEALAPFVYSIF